MSTSAFPVQPPTEDPDQQQQQTDPVGTDQPDRPTQEHTPSNPMVGNANAPENSGGLTEEDQKKLMDLVRRYKTQWQQDRIAIVTRCMENIEFFKGNQYISLDPLSFQYFDTMNWVTENHAQDSDDDDLYQYCNNFYQMLCTGFIAALSPQLPKQTFLPEDADDLTDVTTAKASVTLIEIIQRQNKAMSLLKQRLFYLFNCGSIFRHTRYVVDSERAGTRTEPQYDMVDMPISEDHYHCFNCGADIPADSMAAMVSRSCPKCGAPLGPESYFEGQTGPMLKQVGEEELPNGMVAWTIYSPLEVDCDPQAKNLRETPILSLSVEVHLGALRASYPQMYPEITASTSDLTGQGDSIDRTARQMMRSPSGTYGGQEQSVRPTLDRTWIQPWAFNLEEDQDWANRMRKLFAKGVLLVTTGGTTFLEAREAKLTSEWTWAAVQEGVGLYPTAPGDIITPFQKRYNNACAVLDDFMERCSAGVVLGDTSKIDSKSLNGKALLPGVINPVKLKQGGSLEQALWQFQFQLEGEIAQYLEKMIYNAQMFAGVPPQVYGGAGDPNIQTMGGQEQQLQVALGKLNIYWDNLREEDAEAAALAVLCAKNNLTDDMRQVIQSKGSEYRNNYVRLDEIQGSVAAYPDTDQAFPLSAAELRGRWSELMQSAEKNPFAQAIFDEPANQDQAATALGVPGMVIPGSAMRSKVLQILEQLSKSAATPTLGPDGQPTGQTQPSIMPDREIDDFDITRKVVRQYCQENADLKQKNPGAWANILAYLSAAVAMQTQFQSEQEQSKAQIAQAGMPPQPQAPPPPQIPPDEISKVVGRLNDLMDMDPSQTKGVIAGQVGAAGQLIKVGQSLAGK
jgi:hypothetical protein